MPSGVNEYPINLPKASLYSLTVCGDIKGLDARKSVSNWLVNFVNFSVECLPPMCSVYLIDEQPDKP